MLRRLGDVDGGIPPSLTIHARCTRLIECLTVLQPDPHFPEAPGRLDADLDGRGGDDAYDALRLGLLAFAGRAGAARDEGARIEEWLRDWRG